LQQAYRLARVTKVSLLAARPLVNLSDAGAGGGQLIQIGSDLVLQGSKSMGHGAESSSTG